MSNMNTNWPRWIFASITQHFADAITNYDVFVEGMDRKTNTLKDIAEIRVDGPRINEQSKDDWRIYVEINILIQSVMNDSDLHRLYRIIGDVNVAFQTCILVYKYGTGDDDDQSKLGCFNLVSDEDNREQIITSNFGQIDKSVRLQQATVEAHYEMFLSTLGE